MLAIRPVLHCPEIDEEDELPLEQVIASLDGEALRVGSQVTYQG